MSEDTVTHTGSLWRWTGSNGVSWHFITIDGEAGEHLSAIEAMRRLEFGRKPGFRSIKVAATIGETSWNTSCFPGSSSDNVPGDDAGWLLPIKAAVRKAEGIGEGDKVTVTLAV